MSSSLIMNRISLLFASILLSNCAFTERAMPLTMSNANVLAVLDTIDQIEIDADELARRRATFQNVKSFAARLAHEHASATKERSHLAENIDVVPKKPQLALALERMHAESKEKLLNNKSGRDFDEAYIKYQIMLHEELINLVQDTEESMDHPALRQHLRFTRPDLLSHLSAARAVERQLVAQR